MLNKRETEKFLEKYFAECMQYWTAALPDKSKALGRALYDIDLLHDNQNGKLLDVETKAQFIRNKKMQN